MPLGQKPLIKPREKVSERSPSFIIKETSPLAEVLPKETSEQEELKEQISLPEISIAAETPTTKVKAPVIQPQVPTASPPPAKSPALRQIESILEEGMSEAFAAMDQATQIRFQEEGERTARKIEVLLYQLKVKIKAILDLIRRWLKIIPGVNKYFIEQETKIKGDKIMALRK